MAAKPFWYATGKGHVFLDRRLYLPEEWGNDAERRAPAKVPSDVSFQTKPEQAMAMLEQAWHAGVPMRWVTGDEVYGDAPELRDLVARHGRWYVRAVRTPTPVGSQRPAVVAPEPQAHGRPRTKVRLADGAAAATTVKDVVANWPEGRWQRLTVAEGEKGLTTYAWACQRVVESRNGLPGPDAWLMARRSISDPTEIAYYLSNAPADTPLLKLAQVAATRHAVEQCIEEAKGETGLDDYEVRYWHSWHRHIGGERNACRLDAVIIVTKLLPGAVLWLAKPADRQIYGCSIKSSQYNPGRAPTGTAKNRRR